MSDADFASQARSRIQFGARRCGQVFGSTRCARAGQKTSVLCYPTQGQKLESADHLMEENGKAEVNTVPPSSPSEQNSEKLTARAAGQPSLGTRVFQNTAAQLIGRVISIAFSAV